MKTKLLVLVAAITVLSWSRSAGAWEGGPTWDTTRVTMRAARVSFPAGSGWRTSVGTVANRFDENPSEFQITQTFDDTDVDFDNGQNEVWWSGNAAYAPATTFPSYDWWTGHIVEKDIAIYVGEPLTTMMNKTSLSAFGGPSHPFETLLLHEYGHVAGLHHESDEYNIMGDDRNHLHTGPGQTVRSYLGEDAADGLIALYGRRSTAFVEDVSVSIFKYAGEDDGYSTHTLCQMYNSRGIELPSIPYNGQRAYRVSAGQQVGFELTLENNGETTRTGSLGFYVASDGTVDTADTHVASTRFSLTRDNVVTQIVTITLPETLVPGIYFLGAYIDDDDAICEVDEANVAYHIIRVVE